MNWLKFDVYIYEYITNQIKKKTALLKPGILYIYTYLYIYVYKKNTKKVA